MKKQQRNRRAQKVVETPAKSKKAATKLSSRGLGLSLTMPHDVELARINAIRTLVAKEAVAAVAAELKWNKKNPRCWVEEACGTGKARQQVMIARRLKSGKVLVVVPQLNLLDQVIETWTEAAKRENFKLSYRVFASESKKAETDEQVSTDPQDVKKFLAGPSKEIRVIFSTYQSVYRLKNVSIWDLILLDEAHMAAGLKPAKSERNFKLVLDKKLFKTKALVGMTATPVLPADDDEAGWCMTVDDPKGIFGRRAYRYSFKQARDDGIICDLKIVVLHGDVRLLPRDNEMQVLSKFVDYGRKLYSAKKTMCAFTEIDRAVAFSEVSGCAVASSRPKHYKQTKTYKSDIMTSESWVGAIVGMFGLGFDAPALDSVALLDPRSSPINLAQLISRALRPYPGKTCAHLFVPLAVDGDTIDDLNGEYRKLRNVLKAMLQIDETICKVVKVRKPEEGENGDDIVLPPASPPGIRGPEKTKITPVDVSAVNDEDDAEGDEVIDLTPGEDGVHAPTDSEGGIDLVNLNDAFAIITKEPTKVEKKLQRRVEEETQKFIEEMRTKILRTGQAEHDNDEQWEETRRGWEEMYAKLGRELGRKSKDLRERYLARWMDGQRQLTRPEGKGGYFLSNVRRRALEETKGWSLSPKDKKRQTQIDELTVWLATQDGREPAASEQKKLRIFIDNCRANAYCLSEIQKQQICNVSRPDFFELSSKDLKVRDNLRSLIHSMESNRSSHGLSKTKEGVTLSNLRIGHIDITKHPVEEQALRRLGVRMTSRSIAVAQRSRGFRAQKLKLVDFITLQAKPDQRVDSSLYQRWSAVFRTLHGKAAGREKNLTDFDLQCLAVELESACRHCKGFREDIDDDVLLRAGLHLKNTKYIGRAPDELIERLRAAAKDWDYTDEEAAAIEAGEEDKLVKRPKSLPASAAAEKPTAKAAVKRKAENVEKPTVPQLGDTAELPDRIGTTPGTKTTSSTRSKKEIGEKMDGENKKLMRGVVYDIFAANLDKNPSLLMLAGPKAEAEIAVAYDKLGSKTDILAVDLNERHVLRAKKHGVQAACTNVCDVKNQFNVVNLDLCGMAGGADSQDAIEAAGRSATDIVAVWYLDTREEPIFDGERCDSFRNWVEKNKKQLQATKYSERTRLFLVVEALERGAGKTPKLLRTCCYTGDNGSDMRVGIFDVR